MPGLRVLHALPRARQKGTAAPVLVSITATVPLLTHDTDSARPVRGEHDGGRLGRHGMVDVTTLREASIAETLSEFGLATSPTARPAPRMRSPRPRRTVIG